ncbi:MAG: lipoprotein signal peptidase [Muribaculaceae bacterium]|nr:lipoprotein signal peptidase [Muribaculaceae bacterium]
MFLAFVIMAILIFDQWLKIWVKTHFYLGEDYEITSWFHLHFIENNGFAFGLDWFNKYLLTFGRILAVILFIWLLRRFMSMPGLKQGFLISVALIIAGAAGNIFDCVFYGELFNNPYPPQVAQAFPPGGGYAGWFEGRVVDMLYFPLFSFVWPDWIPIVGGESCLFFQYIFNIADASITIGVLLLIFFYSNDAAIALNTLTHRDDMGGDKLKESSDK